MKSRGSAMVIAFFLMAAVGGVAFGIGRIFVLDSAISSLYENGAVAFYAAESGIEEGMLRYRFDQNDVVPTAIVGEKANRYNLSSNVYAPNTPKAQTVTNSYSIYDMTMSYKADYYGNNANKNTGDILNLEDLKVATYSAGENSIYKISRDESVKIDVSDLTKRGADLKFFVRMSNFGGQSVNNVAHSFIEAKMTGTSSGLNEYKKALIPTSAINILNFSPDSTETLTTTTDSTLFHMTSLISVISGSALNNSAKTELTIKPVGCDIEIALVPEDGGTMASPWTTVTSIGYFGDATRTLTAKIDRQSGTVYDLFDFVVYKHD